MQRRLNQAGFSVVESLLLTIIVLLVGFIGYYVWHTNQVTTKTIAQGSTTPSTQQTAPAANSYASWKSYTTKAGGMTFRYPADWALDYAKATSPDTYDDIPNLTAPDGFVLELGAESTGHPTVDFPIYIQFAKPVTYAGKSGYLNFVDLSSTTNNTDAGKPSTMVSGFALSQDKTGYTDVPQFKDNSGTIFNIYAQGITKQPETITAAKVDPDYLQAAKIVQSITLPH